MSTNSFKGGTKTPVMVRFTFFIKSAWLVTSSACLSLSWVKRTSAAWARPVQTWRDVSVTFSNSHASHWSAHGTVYTHYLPPSVQSVPPHWPRYGTSKPPFPSAGVRFPPSPSACGCAAPPAQLPGDSLETLTRSQHTSGPADRRERGYVNQSNQSNFICIAHIHKSQFVS